MSGNACGWGAAGGIYKMKALTEEATFFIFYICFILAHFAGRRHEALAFRQLVFRTVSTEKVAKTYNAQENMHNDLWQAGHSGKQ